MHPDSSVSLTFSLDLYPVLVLVRPPILYHFHSIHYHPHTHSKLCLIWTHQLACYCSESSSIIIHLTIPLFSATSVHPGPSHTSPNWLATPPNYPLLEPLFPHVYYNFPSLLAILLHCLTQKMKALHSLKTLGTTHPMTMSHLISTAIWP